MTRVNEPLTLTEEERATLQQWVRRRNTTHGFAQRARIVLASEAGLKRSEIARQVGVCFETVTRWRRRFSEKRLDGLLDEPRPGQPRKITDAIVEEVITKTLETTPQNATHWSTRSMAKAVGLDAMAISRIWRAFGLKPHRQDTFKLSTDPLFIDKVRDIVGLYLSPPSNALVLCVDEKSQIQALDRTQPLLPMRPGQAQRRTYDYKRNGTTTLFAALDVKSGKLFAQTHRRHRATELRKFLTAIDRDVPQDLDVHVIMDNYGTHKTKLITDWFAKRPRFHLHFTPTYSSWINMVERWFALLTEQQLRRAVHRSTAELEQALRAYVSLTNENPKPFVWRKTADEILESIGRFCQRTNVTGH